MQTKIKEKLERQFGTANVKVTAGSAEYGVDSNICASAKKLSKELYGQRKANDPLIKNVKWPTDEYAQS